MKLAESKLSHQEPWLPLLSSLTLVLNNAPQNHYGQRNVGKSCHKCLLEKNLLKRRLSQLHSLTIVILPSSCLTPPGAEAVSCFYFYCGHDNKLYTLKTQHQGEAWVPGMPRTFVLAAHTSTPAIKIKNLTGYFSLYFP